MHAILSLLHQAKNKKERMTTVSSKLIISDEIFVDNDVVQRKQYVCPICSYLLKNAVQTSCGDRFCQDCVEALFKKRYIEGLFLMKS